MYYFEIYLANIGWIRIRMDPVLLPGSGSGTRKVQSWIRNKQFRIHNTADMLACYGIQSDGRSSRYLVKYAAMCLYKHMPQLHICDDNIEMF